MNENRRHSLPFYCILQIERVAPTVHKYSTVHSFLSQGLYLHTGTTVLYDRVRTIHTVLTVIGSNRDVIHCLGVQKTHSPAKQKGTALTSHRTYPGPPTILWKKKATLLPWALRHVSASNEQPGCRSCPWRPEELRQGTASRRMGFFLKLQQAAVRKSERPVVYSSSFANRSREIIRQRKPEDPR